MHMAIKTQWWGVRSTLPFVVLSGPSIERLFGEMTVLRRQDQLDADNAARANREPNSTPVEKYQTVRRSHRRRSCRREPIALPVQLLLRCLQRGQVGWTTSRQQRHKDESCGRGDSGTAPQVAQAGEQGEQEAKAAKYVPRRARALRVRDHPITRLQYDERRLPL